MQQRIQRVMDRAGADPNLNETAYLRDLAGLVRALSEESRMKAVIRRWADVNELRTPDRAPVWCRPVSCWKELLPSEALWCRDPFHRAMEVSFRKTLIKHDIGDDEIIRGDWPVGPVITVSPANTWGVEIGVHASPEQGGAWGYDPPLKSPDDFDRLAAPDFAYDAEATHAAVHRYEEVLGDAMPVTLKIAPGFDSATVICSVYAQLRGLENLMMDTVVEPELAHRLCRHITDARLRYLDTLEAVGLNATNRDTEMLCCDSFGPASMKGRYTLANCWCAGNSQEFDQVSPEGFREFLLNYQVEIFRRFGRVSYGCCENLTHKMDLIMKQVPNLRLLTCSAWTDLGRLADAVGDRYAIMWRHKATDVCFAKSILDLRPSFEKDFGRLQGCHYQVVLRELQTLNGHLDRLHDWTRLCIELAETYAGS